MGGKEGREGVREGRGESEMGDGDVIAWVDESGGMEGGKGKDGIGVRERRG